MDSFDTFNLTIAGGNDAMQTAANVAEALRRVADKLDSGRECGTVLDVNGNTVGRFGFDEGTS